MMVMRPRASQPRLRVDTIPEVQTDKDPLSSTDAAGEKREYPHTSVFRSAQIEIHVRSPSVKVARQRSSEAAQSVPVFGDHDRIEGTVLLDSALCMMPGRLTISMEGAFLYIAPGNEAYDSPIAEGHGGKVRHTFFLSSMVNLVGGLSGHRSTSSLRDAFAASVRSRRRSPSETNIGALRPFPFSFEIPRSNRTGEEMPPSFSSVGIGETAPRGRTCVEHIEVAYRVFVTWETADEDERMLLEAPILYHPETDFQSLDGSMEPDSWIEIPLRSDRPIPFKCAVTTPSPATFSRSASIPYFVVFTTMPRSPLFAREIAADATIVVSLVRQVNIDAPATPSPSPVVPSSTSSDESEIPRAPKRRLLKRVVKSAPTVMMRNNLSPDKPLPQLPERISATRTLQTEVCIGFPKRPRHRHDADQRHPPLDAHLSLPDGLHKGRIQLDRDMSPEVTWTDFSIKYFLEASVVFGQDELRARVPLRIF